MSAIQNLHSFGERGEGRGVGGGAPREEQPREAAGPRAGGRPGGRADGRARRDGVGPGPDPAASRVAPSLMAPRPPGRARPARRRRHVPCVTAWSGREAGPACE